MEYLIGSGAHVLVNGSGEIVPLFTVTAANPDAVVTGISKVAGGNDDLYEMVKERLDTEKVTPRTAASMFGLGGTYKALGTGRRVQEREEDELT